MWKGGLERGRLTGIFMIPAKASWPGESTALEFQEALQRLPAPVPPEANLYRDSKGK